MHSVTIHVIQQTEDVEDCTGNVSDVISYTYERPLTEIDEADIEVVSGQDRR